MFYCDDHENAHEMPLKKFLLCIKRDWFGDCFILVSYPGLWTKKDFSSRGPRFFMPYTYYYSSAIARYNDRICR